MARVKGGEFAAYDRPTYGDATEDTLADSVSADVSGSVSSSLGASLTIAVGAFLVIRFLLHSRPDGLGIIARHAGALGDTVYSLAYGICLMLFWGAAIYTLFVTACWAIDAARRPRGIR